MPFFTEILGYKGPILCSQPTKSILPVTLEDFRKVMSEYKGLISILTPEQIKNCVSKIQTIEINEKVIRVVLLKTSPYNYYHLQYLIGVATWLS